MQAAASSPSTRAPTLVHAYVASAIHRRLQADVRDALVAPWTGHAGQPAFYRQIAQADRADTDEIAPRYGDLDIPVLVWGTRDSWIPVDRAFRLHTMFRGRDSC